MKSKLLTLILAAGATAFAAKTPAPAPATKGEQTGTASFYSTRFDGRITAGRQRFSSQKLTAASRDLPLGSRVKITNLANNRSVIVRINDRGPFVKGRVISVTRRAARQLGFIKAGTAQVRITPLG